MDRHEVRRVVLSLCICKEPEGGVSDHHEGQAGRTVVGTTVRRRTLRKYWETLIRGVSDHHDGRAGRTVVGMSVRGRTLRKC